MTLRTDRSDASALDVRAKAVELLARREHAPAELAFKLGQRGYPDGLIRQVLDELTQENLLSSARYAEVMVRSRVDKGHGPLRIRDELAGKGIDETLIEDALDAAQTDWCELAGAVRVKRFGAASPQNFPDKARQMRFLQQRGFAGAHIQAALENYPDR